MRVFVCACVWGDSSACVCLRVFKIIRGTISTRTSLFCVFGEVVCVRVRVDGFEGVFFFVSEVAIWVSVWFVECLHVCEFIFLSLCVIMCECGMVRRWV